MDLKAGNSHRVLILDADFVSALIILRSLSRQGIVCDIASSKSKPICQFSRYAKSIFQYPDPLTEKNNFIDFISCLLRKEQYDLIIPVTERSLIPLSESKQLDPWREQLAITNHSDLIKVLDKSKTIELAKQYEISTPFSHTISTIDEIESIAHSLDYPIVIKPGQSIPNTEHRKQLNVCYAHNEKELFQLCKDLLPYCQLLIQQYVQGIGTGIELLANRGEIVYAFQHERLHELPLSGGGSCLRKSVPVDPDLFEAARLLISALNWHGVAMVEFKWQPKTKQFWLMEINGRFWGSLPLADAAQADFPKMLFDLIVLKSLPKTQYYKENIYCRQLASDIYWLEQVLRKIDSPLLFNYPSKLQIIRDITLAIHPTKHFFDVQSFSDPVPGLIDILDISKTLALRIYELLRFKTLIKYHSSQFIKKRLINQLKKANNILFLCYGNINRSALAQAIAEQSINEPTNITFTSAGFHQHENRPADPNMIKVSDTHTINLKDSRSTVLTETIINQNDLILAMEIQHLDRLANEYPNIKKKCFLLGSLQSINSSSNVEISDPYNQDFTIYLQVFKRINDAINTLTSHLKGFNS